MWSMLLVRFRGKTASSTAFASYFRGLDSLKVLRVKCSIDFQRTITAIKEQCY